MATRNRPLGAEPCKPTSIIGDGNPFWISDTRAAFPLDVLIDEALITVGWPEREYWQILGHSGMEMLGGDALHLAKSGATSIDRLHFFSSAFLALRVADILEG